MWNAGCAELIAPFGIPSTMELNVHLHLSRGFLISEHTLHQNSGELRIPQPKKSIPSASLDPTRIRVHI